MTDYAEHLSTEYFQLILDELSIGIDSFFWSSVIVLGLVVYVSFRYLASWKIKNPGPTSNFVVLAGQLLLSSSLYFCFRCIYNFWDASFFTSFVFCCVSCCLNSLSLLISYDFRNPTYQKLGLLLSVLGTTLNIYSSFHMYNSQWSKIAHVPYVVGLQIFVIGATMLCMHMLNAVDATPQGASLGELTPALGTASE